MGIALSKLWFSLRNRFRTSQDAGPRAVLPCCEALEPRLLLDATGPSSAELFEYAEWHVDNPSWSGNAFDVIADVDFTHVGSGETRTTQMFYDGNDDWRFRFTGTQTGTWNYTTSSGDSDLNGLSGSINITPNSDPEATGFVVSVGTKYAIQRADGELQALSPHVYGNMDGKDRILHWSSTKKVSDATQGDVDFYMDLADRDGFDWVFYDVIANRWFQDGAVSHNEHSSENPDLDTFEALDMVITRTRERGKFSQFWAWGDEARQWTPVGVGGINGTPDQRLQRYIAARLGPLPGWTMGYGFDLHEWVSEAQVGQWSQYMHDHMGWDHLLMARARSHSALDVVSHPGLLHSYQDAVNNLNGATRPQHFGERDNHQRESGHTMDWTRRHVWLYTMAGGHSCHFGKWGGDDYPNPEQLHTHLTFWSDNERFKLDMQPNNGMSGDSDTLVLESPSQQCLVAYRRNNASSIHLNLSGYGGSRAAVAVDTKSNYSEVNLGVLSASNQTVNLPYSSEWAIAVGDFDGAPDDTTPPTQVDGLSANAVSDSQIDLTWNAASDPESGIAGYNVYRDGALVANVGGTSYGDTGLSPETTYTYEIAAVNGAGLEGTKSSPVQESTQAFSGRAPEDPADAVAGIEYEVFDGSWSSLPDFDSLTAVETGVMSVIDLTPERDNTDNFAMRWTGYVEVPTDASYTFYTASDDGSQLFVGETMVVDNDGLHAVVEQSGTIGLEAGKHAMTVTFFEKTGGEAIDVRFEGGGLSKQVIPAANLFHVGEGNQAPTAVDDNASTNEGTPVTIDVLGNDSDPDAGDTLTVDSVTQGAHGSVTNNGSDVTYTPDAGFTGDDTFEYTVADGNGGYHTATVTVTVSTGTVQWAEGFDGLPDGTQSDSGATAWTTDTGNLGPNASFEVNGGQFQAGDTDGVGVWQTEAIDISSAGSVSVSLDVSGEGSLDVANDWLRVSIRVDGGALQEIGYFAGAVDAETVSADGISGSALEIVIEAKNTGDDESYYWDNVSVTGGTDNTPPVAEDDAFEVAEDGSHDGALSATDDDPGDTLTYAIAAPPAHGTLTAFDAATGEYTYEPADDYCGADSFTFTAHDGAAPSNEATVSITVTAVNDAPSFTPGGDVDVAQDSGAASIANWATGISAGPANESSQAVGFLVENDSPALFSAQPAVSADGTLTFTPAAGATGSASVTVRAHDDGGTAGGGEDTSAPETFTITVEPKPAGPVDVVIDNLDAGFTTTGTWLESYAADEYAGSSVVGYEAGAAATWTPDLPEAGLYEVSACWSGLMGDGSRYDRDSSAEFEVHHALGTAVVTVDQDVSSGHWVHLGDYDYEAGTSGFVVLVHDAEDPQATSADAVRFIKKPTVGIPELVVDNLDAGFAATGTWLESYATDEYAGSSVVGYQVGATATWTPDLPATTDYEVYAWWSGQCGQGCYDRDSQATYTITHAEGTTTVDVDQDANPGEWVSLGTYTFQAGASGSVMLKHDSQDPQPTSADAVKFAPVADVVIVDNQDAGRFATTGTWVESYAADEFAGSSVVSTGSGAAATWTPDLPGTGAYDVYAWWSGQCGQGCYDRDSQATYTIAHADGTASVDVDQDTGSGQWVFLGAYQFESGTSAAVTLTHDADDGQPTSADAVKFVRVAGLPEEVISAEVVVDNQDAAGFATTGTWLESFASDEYAGSSVCSYSVGATAKWTPYLPNAGSYEVYAWWSANVGDDTYDRDSQADYVVTHADGQTVVTVDQDDDSGEWVLLGTYGFEAGTGGFISLPHDADDASPTVADAVRLIWA
jgi:hypothetical protein